MAKIGRFDPAFWLYMNEQEGTGLVTTRTGKLNAIGRELKDHGYAGQVVPHDVFESLLHRYKLTNITQDEIRRIEEKWL